MSCSFTCGGNQEAHNGRRGGARSRIRSPSIRRHLRKGPVRCPSSWRRYHCWRPSIARRLSRGSSWPPEQTRKSLLLVLKHCSSCWCPAFASDTCLSRQKLIKRLEDWSVTGVHPNLKLEYIILLLILLIEILYSNIVAIYNIGSEYIIYIKNKMATVAYK